MDPSQVRMYGRPANATDEVLWQKAVRENPDPAWSVVTELVDLDLIDGLLVWFPFSPLGSMTCKNAWTPRLGKQPPIRRNFRYGVAAELLPVQL